MERTLTAEERIRRAEEIYYRRKAQNLGTRVSTNSSNNGTKPDYRLLKKMIVQILICITIYLIFYMVQNTNYIFSTDVINKTKEILSYDINFPKVFKEISNYCKENLNFIHDNQDIEKENIEMQETNSVTEQSDNVVEENQNEIQINKQEETQTEENIGGADATENIEQVKNTINNNEGLSQMEIDANYIKSKYTIIKPLQGTITSRFGPRNPTTATVPKNHTGIDIAANTGTVIYAALDGIVRIASSEGDYGKHLRIQKDDIAIYYAHCNKLYVSEGQEIKQGQAIGEVGATRKCNRTAFAF